MTRDEAKEQATVTRYCTVYDANSSLNNPKFSLIDEIYDDFESRTCECCKWYRPVHTGESVKECKLYDIAFGDTFGCPKFERKEV